ncbi:hypothetical protein FISHEDRAFT_77220 [Fistulina hepatica ATCC 64428]|uniref:Uncharacterized protein n=1 Tax=Fistulina hepatica ATCC 64428 TaxID=1128425 RepID=A0A0D7A267_9AGAR|nr:hypothetical protein FISHEDRAFT_77220 [Fistulina hepatica ATCC 64428]
MAAARGAGMAVACVGSIALSAGAMFGSAVNAKANQGPASLHKSGQWPHASDKNMGTEEIAAILRVPRPGDRRRRLAANVAPRPTLFPAEK